MKATKPFNGKAIYNPSGKAGEYAQWACNFYVGCSNGCTYCYCKKGILAGVMGQDKPQLKKCFKNDAHAITTFLKEMNENIYELQKHGLFFTFTSDPFLKETILLNQAAIQLCVSNSIPVKVLTKCTWWIDDEFTMMTLSVFADKIAFGFTLTGHDELEPNASTNAERIVAMKKLHDAGLKTFASIEPVIETLDSIDMIRESKSFCDLFKIGLLSGSKLAGWQAKAFVSVVAECNPDNKIYFKDSLLKLAGISRESLPENCVTRDYNLFK